MRITDYFRKRIEITIKPVDSYKKAIAQWEAVRDTVEQLNPGFIVYESFPIENNTRVFLLERSDF